MENLIVYENPQFGKIRTLNIDGEPWFVAADVCKAIGVSNTREALKRIEIENIEKMPIHTSGGTQTVSVISAKGLMEIVLGSRKYKAKAFRKWMKNTVFPSLNIEWTLIPNGKQETINDTQELQIYQNEQFGNVRVKIVDGEPWFVATDVCRILSIQNTPQAMERIDEDDKRVFGGTYSDTYTLSAWYVNEPGLYSLVLESNKPEAKAFRRWIAHEVIPSIRKTGHYSAVDNDEITISQKTLALIVSTTVAECIKQFPAFHHPAEFSDETKEPQNLPSDMKGRYCKHLRAFMKENGMCQRDLSRALNIRPGTIHNWWHGLTVPRPSRQILIAELFNVSPSDFWEE